MVEVVMGGEHQLDVLEAQAQPAQAVLERRSAPSSRGPVSTSVSGSPTSSHALTEPTWARGSGMGTARA